jgi:tripartite ATP-independent transporter DctM subunit
MLSALFVGYIVLRATINPELAPSETLEAAPAFWERWRPFLLYVLPLLSIFGLVVGAMSAGWATPTEAAALGAAGTIVAAICYRGLTVRNLMQSLLGTVAISGIILFIIVGATTFSQVLSFSGVVNGIIGLITGQGLAPMTVLIGMILILLVLGCFVDQVSMMLITLPFFMPLVNQLNFDPIWFGIIFLICMQLGLLTPPFGLLLYTMKGVAPPEVTMNQIYMAALPFVLFGLLVLLLIILFPPIATWLPSILSS